MSTESVDTRCPQISMSTDTRCPQIKKCRHSMSTDLQTDKKENLI